MMNLRRRERSPGGKTQTEQEGEGHEEDDRRGCANPCLLAELVVRSTASTNYYLTLRERKDSLQEKSEWQTRSEEARLPNDIAVKGSEVINLCVCERERETSTCRLQ